MNTPKNTNMARLVGWDGLSVGLLGNPKNDYSEDGGRTFLLNVTCYR